MLGTGRARAYALDDVQLAVEAPCALHDRRGGVSEAEPFGIMPRREDAPFKAAK
jgi:hypothetical protein